MAKHSQHPSTERAPIGVSIVAGDADHRGSLIQSLALSHDVRLLSAHDSIKRAFHHIVRLKPRVVLLGASPHDHSCSEWVYELKAGARESLLMVVAAEPFGERVWSSLLAGAHGYLITRNMSADLPVAVLSLVRHGSFVCPEAMRGLIAFLRPTSEKHPAPQALTIREEEVLATLATRRSNKEIAQSLGISHATAHSHLANIFRKLGVHSRREAAHKLTEGRASSGLHETL